MRVLRLRICRLPIASTSRPSSAIRSQPFSSVRPPTPDQPLMLCCYVSLGRAHDVQCMGRRLSMWNKDEMEGKKDQVKGKTKQAAGDLTDNEDLKAEGEV